MFVAVVVVVVVVVDNVFIDCVGGELGEGEVEDDGEGEGSVLQLERGSCQATPKLGKLKYLYNGDHPVVSLVLVGEAGEQELEVRQVEAVGLLMDFAFGMELPLYALAIIFCCCFCCCCCS